MNIHDDTLDVRDIISRIEDLEAEREALQTAADEAEDAYNYHDSEDTQSTPEWEDLKAARAQLQEWDDSEANQERVDLMTIMEDLQGNGGDEQWRGDWYPVTLIRDSYFTEYAADLIADIGALPRDLPSYIVIDWEETAGNIRVDYSCIEIQGIDYWYR